MTKYLVLASLACSLIWFCANAYLSVNRSLADTQGWVDHAITNPSIH